MTLLEAYIERARLAWQEFERRELEKLLASAKAGDGDNQDSPS